MTLPRLKALLATSAVALAGLLVTAPAEAAAVQPGVVVRYERSAVAVKPKAFQPNKDVRFTGVRWSRLTRSTGSATALRHVRTCRPSCANPTYRRAWVRLTFSRVLPFNGRPVFTTLTATEIASRRTTTYRLPEGIDWPRATIVLPKNPAGSHCPTGRVTLRNSQAVVGRKKVTLGAVKGYGDLTRDGVTDTVVYVHCKSTGGLDSGDGSGNLLVATQRNGVLVGVGHVGPVGENYGAAKVRNGLLVATVQQRYGTGVQQRTYRWNGKRFVQVAGPTRFPAAR